MLLHRVRPRSVYDVMAAIACFGVPAGGTAYAANTIRSSDIVDNEIGSADIKDNSINTFDVHSFLGVDVVDGSLTGADIAANSLNGQQIDEPNMFFDNSLIAGDIASQAVGSDEVANNSLLSSDLGAASVGADEVTNNSLNDEDISQSVHTDFQVNIGLLRFWSCKTVGVTGIAAGGDHLVLTANTTNADPAFTYQAEYNPGGADGFRIKACNPTDITQDDGVTNFNLLVIDAQ
jgi:hypothetical protein